jgi:hypothetical protein
VKMGDRVPVASAIPATTTKTIPIVAARRPGWGVRTRVP